MPNNYVNSDLPPAGFGGSSTVCAGGRPVTPAINVNDLKVYIADLQGAIAAKQTGAKAVRRPIYLIG